MLDARNLATRKASLLIILSHENEMANNISLSQTDDIAIITMCNNEQANTIDMASCEGLLRALDEVKSSQQHRAVILRGKGSVFSAGGDLAQILQRAR